MQRKPLLLDLCCCEGGASAGYVRAGFDVLGIDIAEQPFYPYAFARADALDVLRALADGGTFLCNAGGYRLADFAAIHASPPCQAFTKAQVLQGNEHPDLIEPMRELLELAGLPWVMENVPGAPLRNPVQLCGTGLALPFMRERIFESNFPLRGVPCNHDWLPVLPEHVFHNRTPQSEKGKRTARGVRIFGHNARADVARKAMDMPWATRDGVAEAIPPAFTHHIGAFLMAEVERRGR